MKKSFVTALLTLATAGSATAAELTVDEIVLNIYHAYKYHGDDGITRAQMDLRDGEGKSVMERQMVVIKKDAPEGLGQKNYVYFLRPPDTRGMCFMVHKHTDRDDDRWLYLPALDLVKRLAAADKRSSFVGSQFVYEDITGRQPKMDTHELEETTEKSYVLKSVPKDPGSVEFASFRTWADRKTFIPIKRVWYDGDGNLLRVFRTLKAKKIQGNPTIVVFSMKNLQTGEETVTTYNDMKYDVGVPDDLFTEANLRRRPRKWLNYK